MLAALVLAALVAGGAIVPAPAPDAVRVIPDEPGAQVLPDDEPTFEAVAADLDGDGSRDVVRLVGGPRGSIVAEAWTLHGDRWEPLGTTVDVVPNRPTGDQGDFVYAGTPARLLVRQVDGTDRVTLARQPEFEDVEPGRECCLQLHDLVLAGGALALQAVAEPAESVGAVLVIDFDGDGTDELLASRSLPPLGDIGYPSEALVYRWRGESFGPPTLTQLPVGSGDAPFVLGDSDGLPGDEAGIINTAAQSLLYRLSLGAGDRLLLDSAHVQVTDALAVPIADGRGVAAFGPTLDLAVMPWPRGKPLGDPIAQIPIDDGDLLGAVDILDVPRLIVRQTDPEALHVLDLPNLTPARGNPVTRSPAAATFASSPLAPYVGPLPGGGLDGAPAVVYAGRLLPSRDLPDAPFSTLDTALIATMAGAAPIGLVGPDRSWLAIRHAPLRDQPLPSGGRLDAPAFQPGSGVSLAPITLARTPELDDGDFEPDALAAVPLPGGELATSATGFAVSLNAPPGSRVYVAEVDPSVVGDVAVVPESGTARVPVVPPTGPPQVAYRASLTVTTPSGHAYVATWDVRVLSAPPPLEAAASTPFGSPEVEVSGSSAPYATVTVAGRTVQVGADGHFVTTVALPPWPTSIELTAADPVGNTARTTLSGVGIFDYRGLPWLPITLVLVAIAGIALYLRVPLLKAPVRSPADDAVLEELDPD